MGLYEILNTGRQGMLANQIALQVTGQNIANVNTPSYSNQRVSFEPDPTTSGVFVNEVFRQRNALMDTQLLTQNKVYGRASAFAESFIQIEQVFNEIQFDGVGASFSEFFSAIQDLTQDPSELGLREGVKARGINLSASFTTASNQLKSVQRNADLQIVGTVSQINTILQGIAKVNEFVVDAGATSYNQNLLLDQRQGLINELSQLVPISTITDQSGAVTVLGMGGMTLIDGANARHFITRASEDVSGLQDIIYVNSSGTETKFTNSISEGKLGGYLQIRDSVVPAELEKLDKLAAQFTHEFNEVHRVGFGTDGSTNTDFFMPNSVYYSPDWKNSDGAKVTASSVVNESLLTFDKYEIKFSAPGTFDVINTSTGATVLGAQAYTSGNAITFDGISVTITNDTGTPAANDVFYVNTFTNSAGGMDISSDIDANVYKIAAGYTAAAGDNQNAMDLAALQNSQLMNNGESTFESYYESQVISVGIQTQQANRESDIQGEMVHQTESLISSISGVSLDEEATNIMKFQHAFDASSKVIQVADELMQKIIELVQ